MRMKLKPSLDGPLRKKLSVALLVFAGLVGTGAVIARPHWRPSSAPPVRQDELQGPLKTSASVPPVILIKCTPYGFVVPDDLNIAPGDYTIIIRNRSGIDAPLNVDFGKKGETPLESKTIPWGEDAIFTLTLEAGDFSLEETSRPEWSTPLAVTQ